MLTFRSMKRTNAKPRDWFVARSLVGERIVVRSSLEQEQSHQNASGHEHTHTHTQTHTHTHTHSSAPGDVDVTDFTKLAEDVAKVSLDSGVREVVDLIVDGIDEMWRQLQSHMCCKADVTADVRSARMVYMPLTSVEATCVVRNKCVGDGVQT